MAARIAAKFIYTHDTGDSREHQIVVEKILPAQPDVDYPLCIDGSRAVQLKIVWGLGLQRHPGRPRRPS
jgi:hypothetical protein